MKFENINEARFAQNLSRAIQIATVSHENEDDTDWSAFAEKAGRPGNPGNCDRGGRICAVDGRI